MSDIDQEKARAELIRVMPRKVRAFVGDDMARDIQVPPGRKRWDAVLKLLATIPWSRLELLDRGGDLLGVVEAQAAPEVEPAADVGNGRDERLLRLLLAGQREVLAMRAKETEQAMQALTGLVGILGDALGTLVKVYQTAIAQAQDAPPRVVHVAAGDGDGEKELASEKLLMQLAPILMHKLMAGTPAAPAAATATPATPANGVKS